MKLNSIPIIDTEEIISKPVEDGVIVIYLRKHSEELPSAYLLEDFSAKIWKLINGRRTVGDMIRCLSKSYQADGTRIKKFVFEFIKKIQESQLVYFKKTK